MKKYSIKLLEIIVFLRGEIVWLFIDFIVGYII